MSKGLLFLNGVMVGLLFSHALVGHDTVTAILFFSTGMFNLLMLWRWGIGQLNDSIVKAVQPKNNQANPRILHRAITRKGYEAIQSLRN